MEKVDLSAAINNSEAFQKAKHEGRLGARSHKNAKQDGTGILADETRQKIRESILRYYQEHPDNTNRNSKSHKEAIRKALGKPIIQYTKDGEVVREYETTEDAGRLSGVKRSNINRALHKEGATAGGFVWRFAPKPT